MLFFSVMPSTSSSSFNGRVPHPNVVSSQSVAGKYDKRVSSELPLIESNNPIQSEPPAKPPRTFLELQFPSNRNLSKNTSNMWMNGAHICRAEKRRTFTSYCQKVQKSTVLGNEVLFKKLKIVIIQMDIGQRTMLFANPFDDLSGQRIARKSCCSHESTLIEEAMKHGNYSILVRLFKIQNRLRNSNIIAEVNQEAENPLSPSVFFCAFSYRFPLKLISKQGEQ